MAEVEEGICSRPHGKSRDSDYPEIGEIVLIIGNEKNRGKWKKGRVLRHIRGKDGVVREYEELVCCTRDIKSSVQLVCPLEIRSRLRHEGNTEELAETRVQGRIIERRAAVDAGAKIRLIAADD